MVFIRKHHNHKCRPSKEYFTIPPDFVCFLSWKCQIKSKPRCFLLLYSQISSQFKKSLTMKCLFIDSIKWQDDTSIKWTRNYISLKFAWYKIWVMNQWCWFEFYDMMKSKSFKSQFFKLLTRSDKQKILDTVVKSEYLIPPIDIQSKYEIYSVMDAILFR